MSGISPHDWKWVPIDTRPLPTGKYLVGHRGHQVVMYFLSPNDGEWMPYTKLGWQGDIFNATHCVLIQLPIPARPLI